MRTMVGEVKASVNPDPIFGHGDIILRIYGPIAPLGYLFKCRIGHAQVPVSLGPGIKRLCTLVTGGS